MSLHPPSQFALMVKLMEILSHREGSVKGTLYHFICFFCVQKSLHLCFPKLNMRGGSMVFRYVEGHLVFLTCFLQMIL